MISNRPRRQAVDFTNETARWRSQVAAYDAEHPSIPRVTCPECSKQMRLATIEPLGEGPSDNKATYVCQCSFTYEIAIKLES
jgi:transposase-like protein